MTTKELKLRILELKLILAKMLLLKRMSNLDKIYQTAYSLRGTDTSPADIAPDELGCAESVVSVITTALGVENCQELVGIIGTDALWRAFIRTSDKWRMVPRNQATAGTIIMGVSGQSKKGVAHGHVGIVGKNGIVMSNNSFTRG